MLSGKIFNNILFHVKYKLHQSLLQSNFTVALFSSTKFPLFNMFLQW